MLYQPETKSMRRDLFSLPELSEGHILHTNQFFNADQNNNQKNHFFKGNNNKHECNFVRPRSLAISDDSDIEISPQHSEQAANVVIGSSFIG